MPLPYNPAIWGELCFEVYADGSVGNPDIEPTCQDAQCALDAMPSGTLFRALVRDVPDSSDPANAMQLTDPSDDRRLSAEREVYPSTWARVDSEAPLHDLATFTQLVNYGRLEILQGEAMDSVEVVVLVTPGNQPIRANEFPILSRRA